MGRGEGEKPGFATAEDGLGSRSLNGQGRRGESWLCHRGGRTRNPEFEWAREKERNPALPPRRADPEPGVSMGKGEGEKPGLATAEDGTGTRRWNGQGRRRDGWMWLRGGRTRKPESEWAREKERKLALSPRRADSEPGV